MSNMSNEFIVDSSYTGYVYVGHAEGLVEADNKDGSSEKRPYFNMYVISPVSDYVSEDYAASGFKAEKLKCLDSDVWQDLKPGDRVKLFFDAKQRVAMVALDQ